MKPVKGHRGQGAVRSLANGQGPRGWGWMGRVGPRAGGGTSETAGDRGRGVVDGRIPSMWVGCTF